jgi:TPR repeat protein
MSGPSDAGSRCRVEKKGIYLLESAAIWHRAEGGKAMLIRFVTVMVLCHIGTSLAGGTPAGEIDPLERGLDAYYSGDYKTAYDFATPLASEGNPEAENLLGMMYELGKGVPKNLRKSYIFYRKAAEQGDKYAQYNLAVSYDSGTGTPQNYHEAIRWFRRAAEQGASFAQYDLAVMLEQGRGTRRNFKEAADWYRKAAQQGHMQAQNNLAWLYESGKGVKQSLIKAYAWFNASAEQGFDAAVRKRDLLKESFTERDMKQAQQEADKLLARLKRKDTQQTASN